MQKISIENLSFYYGKKEVFKNASFEINKGDIIALVGSNASGKTTFLKILAGIYKANKNIDLNVSFMIDAPAFYPGLSIYQNLKYHAITLGVDYSKIDLALDMVNLKDKKNILFKKCSMGMRQKLAIARCLMLDKDIYLFDEPLNGLDPQMILEFRKIIKMLQEKEKTIIISSHIISELEKYATKIFLIENKEIKVFSNIDIETLFLKEKYV